MHLKIRLQHKKLDAIMTMIEKADRRIMLLTRQLEKYPNDVFWRNEHARDINRFRRIRNRLYAYYASAFTKMADMVITKEPPPPPANHLRSEHAQDQPEYSIHLPIFS